MVMTQREGATWMESMGTGAVPGRGEPQATAWWFLSPSSSDPCKYSGNRRIDSRGACGRPCTGSWLRRTCSRHAAMAESDAVLAAGYEARHPSRRW